RTIGVCGLRSKIFRQAAQKDRRFAVANQEIFVQHDGTRFKQGVRRDLCGVALEYHCHKNSALLRILPRHGQIVNRNEKILLFGVIKSKTALLIKNDLPTRERRATDACIKLLSAVSELLLPRRRNGCE
ncbi:MAG: hypothetical protein K6F09_02570, partial [Clostridiales bacterium]|nr:hypothetical protein [Clostridiales bacterium]